MALITSAQSGNFNDTATWTGGVVPTVGDEARAATGHTVTITANATCDEVSNAGTGTFVLNSGVTLTANVTGKSTTTNSQCVTFSGASPNTAEIIGTITGGAANPSFAVSNNGTGTLNITGNCVGGNSGHCAVRNNSTGTINVTGNCTGFGNTGYGCSNASTGTINITGNCTGGDSPGGNAAINSAGGVINITGNCTGGTAGAAALNSSTGTMRVVGSIYASSGYSGVSGLSNTQVTLLTGPFYTNTQKGTSPVSCVAWRWDTSVSSSVVYEVMTNDLNAKKNLYTADNITGMPAASNVKSGVHYGPSSELTGTYAQTVSPSTSDIRDAVWGAATSGMTTSGSIGERLKNASTLATTGQQIADAMSA